MANPSRKTVSWVHFAQSSLMVQSALEVDYDMHQWPFKAFTHWWSQALVRHHHEIFVHAGWEHVLSSLRQKFWIINASAQTRRIHRSFIPCRRRYEGVMKQLMGDLPKPRLKHLMSDPSAIRGWTSLAPLTSRAVVAMRKFTDASSFVSPVELSTL